MTTSQTKRHVIHCIWYQSRGFQAATSAGVTGHRSVQAWRPVMMNRVTRIPCTPFQSTNTSTAHKHTTTR